MSKQYFTVQQPKSIYAQGVSPLHCILNFWTKFKTQYVLLLKHKHKYLTLETVLQTIWIAPGLSDIHDPKSYFCAKT